VEIRSNAPATSIEVETRGRKPRSTIGAEFLTYVLWVVTPEGRTSNVGELLINRKGQGRLSATAMAQTFESPIHILVAHDGQPWQASVDNRVLMSRQRAVS
jgi:hypothetical protein